MGRSVQISKVITFADEKQSCELIEQFHSATCSVEQIDGEFWLSNPSIIQPDDSIVLYIGTLSYPCSEIISVLKKYNLLIRLTIFSKHLTDWEQSLLEFSEEFIVWPCSEQEFRFRIQHRYAGGQSLNYDPDEFAALNLIGKSPEFVRSLTLIRKLAHCHVPVLIEGETGTGKEMAARAIHYLSARADKPFIPLNCAALPDSLIENELFGHEKGAYTDARDDQSGIIEQADGGTLFLDEINSLSHKAQATLLRFLQDQCYKPLGCKKIKQANVRILTASNIPLPQLIAEGHFREDLYYRINIMMLELPPLRQRREDIPLLAEYFLQRYRSIYGKPEKRLHIAAIEWLKQQEWKGNVRELESFMHRHFLLVDDHVITLSEFTAMQVDEPQKKDHMRLDFNHRLSFNEAKSHVLNGFEHDYLFQLLKETHGNVTMAAKRAGKERRALGKLLKKHGIEREQFMSLCPYMSG